MSWKCHTCGTEHDDLPLCFGSHAPCYGMVPEAEFESRVFLSSDQCIVDDEHFFIRGDIEVPLLQAKEFLDG